MSENEWNRLFRVSYRFTLFYTMPTTKIIENLANAKVHLKYAIDSTVVTLYENLGIFSVL